MIEGDWSSDVCSDLMQHRPILHCITKTYSRASIMTILRGFFIFWSQFGCFLHPSAWGLPHNKAMMAGFTPASVVSPCHDRSQAWACAPRRGVGGDRRLRLFSLPPTRLRRGEIPAFREKPFIMGKNSYSVAPIWRDNMQVVGRAAWGRVCGRAKLLAGTLRCLHLC